jgi:hypothetical protein
MRSSRSNSVASSGSKRHRIEEDIEAKLHEAPEPIAPPKSALQLYFERELQFFSEYTALDYLREFSYGEYTEWRRHAEKFNEFHNALGRADVVIAEKYVMDGLNASTLEVPDFTEPKYFEYRSRLLPYLQFLADYIADCEQNMRDVSYVGYEYFGQYMRERDAEVGMFRKAVAESNRVSYSEAIFNEFVLSDKYRPDIRAYEAFYQEKESQQEEEIQKYKQDVAALKKEVENLNLFVFNSFIEACNEQNVQPTIEGYKAHEEEYRKEFDDEYLKEKHEELEDEIEALGAEQQKAIAQTFDDTEVEFLNKRAGSVVENIGKELKEEAPKTEEELEEKIM